MAKFPNKFQAGFNFLLKRTAIESFGGRISFRLDSSLSLQWYHEEQIYFR